MYKRIITTLSVVAIIASSVSADVFVMPVSSKYLKTANEIIITTVDGKEITGASKMVSMIGSMIKKIAIKDADGVKHKFNPEDIKLLKMKMSKMAKVQQIAENASASVKSAVGTDYKALAEKGYAVWENVKSEDGDDAYLLQLFNPSFSTILKVYEKPEKISITSGSSNSFSFRPKLPEHFLVVKNGKTYEVEDDDYDDEHYPAIFGDSPEMMKLGKRDRDFDDFQEHVEKYNNLMIKK